MIKHKNWTKRREQIAQMLADGLKVVDIANEFETSEYIIEQVIHRNRLFDNNKKESSLAYRIIKTVFRKPEYFTPNRNFYSAIGIGQRRWWTLYRGDGTMTDKEFRSVVIHLHLTIREVFELQDSVKNIQTNWLDKLEDIKQQ